MRGWFYGRRTHPLGGQPADGVLLAGGGWCLGPAERAGDRHRDGVVTGVGQDCQGGTHLGITFGASSASTSSCSKGRVGAMTSS